MSQSNRLENIDFLKVVGLICIIIAHVNPPYIVMMLRDFDVPLMVLISAILSERSFKKRLELGNTVNSYYISRFKRLVVPTWIFLVIYFTAFFLLNGEKESLKYYLYSFEMTRYGLGYVWIILIYLYCALLVPVYNRLSFAARNIYILFVCYIFYEICCYHHIGMQSKLIESTVYYIIPYGLLAYIGYNYTRIKRENKIFIILISGTIFFILFAYYWVSLGFPQKVSFAKYPPRIYYLSYGVFCSFILLMLSYKYPLKLFHHPLIKYISSHSMWIYLWHIFVLKAYDLLHLPSFWFIKFTIVLVFSILLVEIINKILDTIKSKHILSLLQFFRG